MILWLKVIHVLAVISWMAGLLYLPRLMVYHATTESGSETSETFKIMERRLLKAIMTPAMVVSWVFGLWIAISLHYFVEAWFYAKLFMVLLMSMFHMFCAVWVKEFARDERRRTSRFFRIANEVPTFFMIVIVILVILKPF